ncbi:MAG: hypothetical protein ACTSP9_04870 [Promethearchaeota archaeon]
MSKTAVKIIYEISSVVAGIFFILWIGFILVPLLMFAETASAIGISFGGDPIEGLTYLLAYLFLNAYFIIATVVGIIALTFKIAARKS